MVQQYILLNQRNLQKLNLKFDLRKLRFYLKFKSMCVLKDTQQQ